MISLTCFCNALPQSDSSGSLQVLDLIHNIDVVEVLISKGAMSVEDWVWVKQLRYYHTSGGGNRCLEVRMADAALVYSWEYQGNAPKLVHTPLTDRCYLTLTQVLPRSCWGQLLEQILPGLLSSMPIICMYSSVQFPL